jgi:hypothetical protein
MLKLSSNAKFCSKNPTVISFLKTTSPSSAISIPFKILNKVVFPEPFLATRAYFIKQHFSAVCFRNIVNRE